MRDGERIGVWWWRGRTKEFSSVVVELSFVCIVISLALNGGGLDAYKAFSDSFSEGIAM